MADRNFLFLQGGSSPFFGTLAAALAAEGHAVRRVHYTGGDRAFWSKLPAESFRGRLDELPDYYADRVQALSISDVVLYGDRRPVHVPAIAQARARGIRVHVFEEGYFRPFLVTLERGGVNGNSALPRDPDWYHEVGARLPDYGYGAPFSSSLVRRAIHDIAYEVANLANPLFFPRYRTHVPYNRWMGYASHLRRYAAFPFHASRDRALIARLAKEEGPLFVLPLQLESDIQIRFYSPIATMTSLISQVMRSFARAAPPGARLAIKNHPLDPGFVNYSSLVARLGRELGVAQRVDYVDTGDASALVHRARGIVTVNSTVGMSSLALGRPVIALGTAIYNLRGLTFQGPLDDFWGNAVSPDPELFRRYRNTVIHATQLHGGFYTPESRALAVENCRRLLLAERSPLEELLGRHAKAAPAAAKA
jgi:capsular polysaccharide export protein